MGNSDMMAGAFFRVIIIELVRRNVIYMAYFVVHCRAVSSYLALSVLYSWAISGTRGTSGLGSVRSEHMDSSTFEMVRAGDHWSLRISRQIDPWAFTLGW